MSHLQELLFEIAAVFNTCQLCSWYCKAAPLSQGRTGKKKIYFFFLKKNPNKTTTLQFIFWNAIVRTRQRFCRITQLPACSPKHRGGGCGSFQQAEFFYWGKRLRDRWEKRGGGGGEALNKLRVKSENKKVQTAQCADYRSSTLTCCRSSHHWGCMEKDEVWRVMETVLNLGEAV